ncbi:hypothetical protein R6Q57_007055 [Mikania cordata]
MAEKDDGLGLGLSLSLKCPENHQPQLLRPLQPPQVAAASTGSTRFPMNLLPYRQQVSNHQKLPFVFNHAVHPAGKYEFIACYTEELIDCLLFS